MLVDGQGSVALDHLLKLFFRAQEQATGICRSVDHGPIRRGVLHHVLHGSSFCHLHRQVQTRHCQFTPQLKEGFASDDTS